MDKIEALITLAEGTGKQELLDAAKAAKEQLAEVERERETTSRRYANLASEHIDVTKRERAMAHQLHRLKLSMSAHKAAELKPSLTPEFETWLDGWTL